MHSNRLFKSTVKTFTMMSQHLLMLVNYNKQVDEIGMDLKPLQIDFVLKSIQQEHYIAYNSMCTKIYLRMISDMVTSKINGSKS